MDQDNESVPPDTLLPGQSVSHYRILGQLGRGGMGLVYRATDTRLGRTVALKFLAPGLAQDPRARARFVREAQAASALDHPNIGTIFEIGESGGRPYIAMALYEGRTLRQRLEQGPLALDEARSILVPIASALAAAHEKGIVHRDLKPANVMLTRSGVKLLDFGLAKRLEEPGGQDARLTEAGEMLGTVAYMAPEQARGQAVDHRTDLWALGVVAYEMLAVASPFESENRVTTLWRILNEEPASLAEQRPGLPPAFEAAVSRLLRKDPAERWQSAAEFLQALPQPEASGLAAPSPEAAGQSSAVSPAAADPEAPTLVEALAAAREPVRRRLSPWTRRALLLAPALGVLAVLLWPRPAPRPEDRFLRHLQAATVDSGAFPVSPSAPGSRTTYYVATNGSDANPGTSPSSPLRSIQHALEVSRDGDAVLVRAGTYVTGDIGSPAHPEQRLHSSFVLAAYPGERVLLKSDAPGRWEHRDGLGLSGPVHDVLVEGFELDGFSDAGIQLTAGPEPQRNIVLRRLTVRGAEAGIAFVGSEGGGAAVDGLLIEDVLLLDVTAGISAPQHAAGPTAYKDLHLDRVKVRCRPDASASAGLTLAGADNVLIENTLVEGAGTIGLDIEASRAAIANCIVRHIGRNGINCWKDAEILNTLVFDTGGDASLNFGGSGSLLVKDCVFAYHNTRSGEPGYSFVVAYDQKESFHGSVTFQNCVFFGNASLGFVPGKARLSFVDNTFWQIGTKRLLEHFGATPGEYAYEDLGLLNRQSWAHGNRIADPGFVHPSVEGDNLITGNLEGPGFKEVLIDRHFAGLEARAP
jgi:protein kinase-like protein/parallel beta helix pectate lyase-like protein